MEGKKINKNKSIKWRRKMGRKDESQKEVKEEQQKNEKWERKMQDQNRKNEIT